jgi:integrase
LSSRDSFDRHLDKTDLFKRIPAPPWQPPSDALILAAADRAARARRRAGLLHGDMAAYAGLRAGELWALRRRDVDVPGRRVIVGRTLRDERGHLTFANTTKTDGSRRVGVPPLSRTWVVRWWWLT